MNRNVAVLCVGIPLVLGGPTVLVGQARIRQDPAVNQAALSRLVGAPVQGLTFSLVSQAFPKLSWAAAPNAASYEVSRRLRTDPACCTVSSGALPAATTSWIDMGLGRGGTYDYTVTVTYADGRIGTGTTELTAPNGWTPAPMTATTFGPGEVRLGWNINVPLTAGLWIVGPGFGASSGKLVIGGGPLDVLLPLGTHTWRAAMVYNVKNLPAPPSTTYWTGTSFGDTYVVLTPPSEWATFTHTVSYGTGRFRVSLERFKAITPAGEDLLRADGRGNEIYLTAQVNEYHKGSPTVIRMARTPTFGDVQNFPKRVRAGTASASGGIQANDEYPPPVEYVSQLAPPSTTNLPYLLWEGDLSEADGVVVVSPSIWEADEDERLFPFYLMFQTGVAPQLVQRSDLSPFVPERRFMPWTPGPKVPLDTWRPAKSCPAPRTPGTPNGMFVPPINGWGDEPIDLNSDHSYCPTYVAINYRVAAAFTNVNRAAVVEVPFTGVSGASYKLFMRIERLQ